MVRQAMWRNFLQTDPTGDRHIHFNRQLLRLTQAQATTFYEKLKALEDEMLAASNANNTDASTIYSFTTVMTPTLHRQLNGEATG